eukprot:jgi/Bigna1/84989/estExt_fgenesh1_pg.C_10541
MWCPRRLPLCPRRLTAPRRIARSPFRLISDSALKFDSSEELEQYDDVIRTNPAEGVAEVRPKSRNALSSRMMSILQKHVDLLGEDASVRAVVLSANGPVFCAGHNLKEMKEVREKGIKGYQQIFNQCSALMKSIVLLPKPIIAQVEGIATAAGCQLVASCDMAVACREKARFATPGVNIGLFCSTPMVALSRKIGRNHAMEMLLTGEAVDANRAMEIGLVNRVVDSPDMVSSEAMSLAALIAQKSSKAVKIGKKAFYSQLEMPLEEAYDFTSDVMAANMMEDDADEGVTAFLEKRAPKWNH